MPGGDATQFPFNTGGGLVPAGFNLTDLSPPQVFSDVTPGQTYTITERVLPGWVLAVTGAGCSFDPATGSVTVTPAAGADVTCTFTNTHTSEQGSITIVKTTSGGDGTFTFNTTGLAPIDVTTTGGTGTGTFAAVPPGSHQIIETVPTGWVAGDFGGDCDATGAIDVEPGQNATCTITNSRTGVLRIVTTALGGDGTFLYTVDGPEVAGVAAAAPGQATLAAATVQNTVTTVGGTGSITMPDLQSGTYAVRQSPEFGWANGPVTCPPVPGSSQSTGTAFVPPGGEVTCTVTNTKLASVIIRKATVPVGFAGTFAFGATAGLSPAAFSLSHGQEQRIDNITPGVPAVVNEVVPVNWELSVSGAGCDSSTTGVTLDLAPGQVVTCTFTNTLVSPTIIVSPPEVPPGSPVGIDIGGLPPGTQIGVEILDPNGRLVGTEVLTVGPDGRVTSSFPVPANFPPGRYTIRVSGPGFESFSQTFAVIEPCPTCDPTASPAERLAPSLRRHRLSRPRPRGSRTRGHARGAGSGPPGRRRRRRA